MVVNGIWFRLWKDFETFVRNNVGDDGTESLWDPNESVPQYICTWIYMECDILDEQNKLRMHCATKTYSHALKMHAAISFCYNEFGRGTDNCHQGKDLEWMGNPSLSKEVSQYMLSQQRRKVIMSLTVHIPVRWLNSANALPNSLTIISHYICHFRSVSLSRTHRTIPRHWYLMAPWTSLFLDPMTPLEFVLSWRLWNQPDRYSFQQSVQISEIPRAPLRWAVRFPVSDSSIRADWSRPTELEVWINSADSYVRNWTLGSDGSISKQGIGLNQDAPAMLGCHLECRHNYDSQ